MAMDDGQHPPPDGIELLPIPFKRRSRWERFKLVLDVYRRARTWGADVYHLHDIETFPIGVMLRWRTDAKLVMDVHECFQYTAAQWLSGWRHKLVVGLTGLFLRLVSRRANQVIVVSYSNEHFYRNRCGCKHVTIIHNSPPPEMFPHDNKAEDSLLICTHDGTLAKNRGQNQMLEALSIIRKQIPARLLVVGHVLPAEREDFERRVAELGLEDAVEITGWLPYSDVGPNLNRGSIGLVAMQPVLNNLHSLSNKLFNYMATGQAVLVPRDSDSAQVVESADCGVAVDMTNSKDIADALLTLMQDPQRTRAMGRNARRAIEDVFGWHLMEQELARIYGELAS